MRLGYFFPGSSLLAEQRAQGPSASSLQGSFSGGTCHPSPSPHNTRGVTEKPVSPQMSQKEGAAYVEVPHALPTALQKTLHKLSLNYPS